MDKEQYKALISNQQLTIEKIKETACKMHDSVGQTYDKTKPYGFHLSMVADAAIEYGHEVIDDNSDILPVIFAAYFHDSIEDARLTYNDVTKIAKLFMTGDQAFTAAEIVYALTNEKGRTRAERAGEKYYDGIRTTPYAPMVKLCDRYANMKYSFSGKNEANNHMREVYQKEWPHFIEAISTQATDKRLSLPQSLKTACHTIILNFSENPLVS